MSVQNGKPRIPLKQRLSKEDKEELADLLWPLLRDRVVAMLKDMASKRGADRAKILAAALSGLAVKWAEGSATHIAELAERIADAVMRIENKRINGDMT